MCGTYAVFSLPCSFRECVERFVPDAEIFRVQPLHSLTQSCCPPQSITEYNGAAMCAMVGKNCVAIASDTRLGIQAQTVATDFQKLFRMGSHLVSISLVSLGLYCFII